MNCQDDRVLRPWAHLLPQAHQNYNYLWSNYWGERPGTSKNNLPLKTQRRNQNKKCRRGRDAHRQDPHP